MIKVLIWKVSNDENSLDGALKILERQHNGIELVGVTANTATSLVYEGKNVTFVPLDKLTGGKEYDVILVIGAARWKILKVIEYAAQFNLPEEKLLGDWIVCLPGFTLEKYRSLQSSCISVIAMNCFGGILLSTFGLPFRTPTINMYFSEHDYIRLLRSLRTYMEKELLFKETKFEPRLKTNYPLVTLGDVSIHMNHYKNFEEAVSKWNERKQRINWDNLFVTTYTSDKKILEQFDELPYDKKVCFVPFKSDLPSAWYIDPQINEKAVAFWDAVNHFALGDPFYYDPFDMLLYAKKTPLIDM